jgi:hypothetical protein
MKASPGAFNLVFQNLYCNYLWMIVHLSSGVVWNLRCMIPRYLVLTSIIGRQLPRYRTVTSQVMMSLARLGPYVGIIRSP